MHKMNTTRVDTYWRETFGLSLAEYSRGGANVVPHSQKLAGRNACWVFLRKESCIVSVPAVMVDDVQYRVRQAPPETLLDRNSIPQLFPCPIREMVGPSYQGFAEWEGSRPFSARTVRTLSASDRTEVQTFLLDCDPAERDDSGLDEDSHPLFGCHEGQRLVALGGIIPWAPYASNIGIIVHPLYRGKGYGKAVASAAMEHILVGGGVVLYQTLLSNHAAVDIAESLGCTLYARMMYVEFE